MPKPVRAYSRVVIWVRRKLDLALEALDRSDEPADDPYSPENMRA